MKRAPILGVASTSIAVVLALIASTAPCLAQLGRSNARDPKQAAAKSKAAPATTPAEEAPKAVMVPVMANPNDPIAIVNGEAISRQQLADECVAQRGEEILDSMIARKLMEQELRKHKLEVTSAEIEAEIDRVAMTLAGTTREQWLRSLAKDRNISPAQYARQIIYPALALRKLARPRVQVTEEDMKQALESQFGEKLSYRMIMTRSLTDANELFEILRKNPGGFEHVARYDPRSIDPTTKADGGKPVNGPLRRHSFPPEVTNRIFAQLVDGDPDDKDPTHKPKDGDISGPIQVSQDAWLIVKREGLIAAEPYNDKDPVLLESIRKAIMDTKEKQQMEQVYAEMVAAAHVENRLKGTIKTADHELPRMDREVKLMNQRGPNAPEPPAGSTPTATSPSTATGTGAAAPRRSPTPVGIDPEDAKLLEDLEKQAASPPRSETSTKK